MDGTADSSYDSAIELCQNGYKNGITCKGDSTLSNSFTCDLVDEVSVALHQDSVIFKCIPNISVHPTISFSSHPSHNLWGFVAFHRPICRL